MYEMIRNLNADDYESNLQKVIFVRLHNNRLQNK